MVVLLQSYTSNNITLVLSGTVLSLKCLLSEEYTSSVAKVGDRTYKTLSGGSFRCSLLIHMDLLDHLKSCISLYILSSVVIVNTILDENEWIQQIDLTHVNDVLVKRKCCSPDLTTGWQHSLTNRNSAILVPPYKSQLTFIFTSLSG